MGYLKAQFRQHTLTHAYTDVTKAYVVPFKCCLNDVGTLIEHLSQNTMTYAKQEEHDTFSPIK